MLYFLLALIAIAILLLSEPGQAILLLIIEIGLALAIIAIIGTLLIVGYSYLAMPATVGMTAVDGLFHAPIVEKYLDLFIIAATGVIWIAMIVANIKIYLGK